MCDLGSRARFTGYLKMPFLVLGGYPRRRRDVGGVRRPDLIVSWGLFQAAGEAGRDGLVQGDLFAAVVVAGLMIRDYSAGWAICELPRVHNAARARIPMKPCPSWTIQGATPGCKRRLSARKVKSLGWA
jgi:hypothetical protein